MSGLLTDALPETIQGLPIAWEFQAMVEIEQLLFDEQTSNADKVSRVLARFYPRGWGSMPITTAWEWLLWFQRCGRPVDDRAVRSGRRSVSRAYDFGQDAPLIVAAFQQAYHIDLLTTEMHWWRFRALFDGLPDSCRLCRIMEYRVADTDDLPPKAQAFYDRMKRKYALTSAAPRKMTKEQHEQDFIKRLRREG